MDSPPASLASILVIEDDEEILESLGMILKSAGYSVILARSCAEASKTFETVKLDLVLVDCVLPEVAGIDVIRKIRAPGGVNAQSSILLITVETEPEELLKAIEAGANDYLQKPFDRQNLMLRVRALIRGQSHEGLQQRESGVDQAGVEQTAAERISIGRLVIDLKSYDVFTGDERIQLTPSEFKLLHSLVLNRGRVLTREKLIELVQGLGIAVIDRAIDTHVFGLRKKLGACAEMIETVRGIGYRFTIC